MGGEGERGTEFGDQGECGVAMTVEANLTGIVHTDGEPQCARSIYHISHIELKNIGGVS